MHRFLKSLALIAACTAVQAHAAIVTHGSWAEYNAATSANTTIDFEAQAYGAYAYYGSSLTVGDVTFTDNAPRLFVINTYYYTTFTSKYLNNNTQGTEVGVQFAQPVYGFALDFGTLYAHQHEGDPLEITFEFGGESHAFELPGLVTVDRAPVSMIGFTSDTPFSSITIHDPTKGLALDNFTYTTTAPDRGDEQSVPEPGSLALAAAALSALVPLRRRRRSPDAPVTR